MALIGLMITRDDEPIFQSWCEDQLSLFDAVVCLDGSTTDTTQQIAARFSDNLIYLHEREFSIPHKTDHGLRRIVHQEIIRQFGNDHWIMCCHPDEFCYHDPRKIVALAEGGGWDLVSWYSPHFYPHPSELCDWEMRRHWPVPDRHRHYHWAHLGTDQPWIEDRLYYARDGVTWDDSTHGSVRPHGLNREAPFHPIVRHFKVIATDTAWCEVIGGSTYYQHHWHGLEHRTGVPFPVGKFEDLFVTSVVKYARCDRFDGAFSHPWNMGEEFRPDRDIRQPTSVHSDTEICDTATPGQTADQQMSSLGTPVNRSNRVPNPRLRIGLGPETPEFGSWNWLAADLAKELSVDHDVVLFREVIPEVDALIFFKFLPDLESLSVLNQRSTVIFCPVDIYGSAAEIDADIARLRYCNQIVVHSQRLIPYFQSYARTAYIDHHLKYVMPTRREVVTEGPVLWVGEQSNLSPVLEWATSNKILADELVILSNASAEVIAEHRCLIDLRNIRFDSWSAENHLAWIIRCRCAIDIKRDDFRARHKPPAKALDFLASGVPLAINQPSSSVEHIRAMGLNVPSPEQLSRWLSVDYAIECQRFGHELVATHSINQIGGRWRSILRETIALR